MTEENKNTEELLQRIRDRYVLCVDSDRDNRDRAKEALAFRNLEQWDESTKNERQNDPEGARPCLVVDKLNQHVMQVVNDERQNRPQIKVRPVDDFGDPETAKIFDGIIRHIQDRSHADIAYDTAFEQAVDGGFGFWRIITEYNDPKSFTQDIRIKRIRNRFSVYLDPARQEPDGSDADYGFILYKIQKTDFKKEFGKNGDDALHSFENDGSEFTEWYGADWVIYAEYFEKQKEKQTIVITEDGSVMSKEEHESSGHASPILKERESTTTKVKWYKVTAVKVLDSGEWVGETIPIAEVVGTELDIEGKVIRSGMIRPAMDAQRVDNYSTSAFIESVALAPRASYIAATGQLEGNEELWRTANRRNISVLPYNPIDVNGIPVPPPQRVAPPGVSQGWLSVLTQAEHNIQASMGRYNASLGAPSNETSGKAIQARNREGDTGSFHYVDNLHRSQRYTGQILLDIIPKTMDTKHIARIIGEDGEYGQANIDPELKDDMGNPVAYKEQTGIDGKIEKIYNLGVGKYDVTIVSGPSYTTRRIESAETMMEIARGNKEFMGQFGDILFKAQDWPGAEKIAERFGKMLPPELKDEQPTDMEKQKAQVQQAAQMIGQKEAEINNAMQQIQEHSQALTEQEQALTEQDKKARDAMSKVEAKISQLNSESQALDAQKNELALLKKLSETQLSAKEVAQQSTIQEAVFTIERMLAEHQKQVEAALDSNSEKSMNGEKESKETDPRTVDAIMSSTENTTGAVRQMMSSLTSEMDGNQTGSVSRLLMLAEQQKQMESSTMDALVASTEATAEAVRQMLASLASPRETQLMVDDQGNPIGSVSRIMQ